MFKGSIVALITPFKDGKVDEAGLRKLVNWHVKEGTHGIVPCGTTGESPTLSHDEHKRVTEVVVEQVAKRVPVIAGCGSNNTAEAIDLTRHARKVGADATLHVAGYYNKPTQEGLYQHFKAINDAVDIPIVVYNIPPRAVVDIQVETMARIAALEHVVGVKDATADLTRPSKERLAIKGKAWIQLSGEDGTALAYMAHGGHGCISVTANVAPRLCAEFQQACLAGDFRKALDYQDRLMPLHVNLFAETSPAPVKFAAGVLGLCGDEVRLPLVKPGPATQAKVKDALRHAGLIN
ncbi:MAG: 4-hydroxy-tetrahydrodipicolinate synthase [Alphaproteobacteria bacterium]|nr:4-hydroxy-tetrahydrodipicolinate synthase [Alphaproteobacteria bacterium]